MKSTGQYLKTNTTINSLSSRINLYPKCLQNVSEMDITTSIFGHCLKTPLGISPTAYHKLADEAGELATARAAEKAGVIYTMSCLASTLIEDIAKAAPTGIKWLQLYIFEDREATTKLVRQAEAHGFQALALTVDSPARPFIYRNMRNEFDVPAHIK